MKTYHHFRIEVADRIATVTFDRPPVNAVSVEVYSEMRDWSIALGASDDVHVVVLTAPLDRKAWCGGADLNEFLKLDSGSRRDRYAHINECVPHFAKLPKPVIAAMTGHAVGVGMVFATLCDIRIGSDSAFFAVPEIDRGVVAGGGAFFSKLGMPEGLVREMCYTGRRFTAAELHSSGFLNRTLPGTEVLPSAIELAHSIADKSLPALRATKLSALFAEDNTWMDAYLTSQEFAAELTGMADSKEGIRAFLERRTPQYTGR